MSATEPIETLTDLAATAPLEHLPILLARLEEARATAWRRLMMPPFTPAVSVGFAENLVNAKEASAIAGGRLSDRWFRRHAAELYFSKRISKRKVLFFEGQLRSYLAARGLPPVDA